MRIKHDRTADAVYVYLSKKKFAYGKDLDDSRRVDYAADDTPIGIELLSVTKGVNSDNLPAQEEVTRPLEEKRIRVFA